MWFDSGAIKDLDPGEGLLSYKSLSSAGFGLRWADNGYQLQFEAGSPVFKHAKDGSLRYFLTGNYSF